MVSGRAATDVFDSGFRSIGVVSSAVGTFGNDTASTNPLFLGMVTLVNIHPRSTNASFSTRGSISSSVCRATLATTTLVLTCLGISSGVFDQPVMPCKPWDHTDHPHSPATSAKPINISTNLSGCRDNFSVLQKVPKGARIPVTDGLSKLLRDGLEDQVLCCSCMPLSALFTL